MLRLDRNLNFAGSWHKKPKPRRNTSRIAGVRFILHNERDVDWPSYLSHHHHHRQIFPLLTRLMKHIEQLLLQVAFYSVVES